MADKLHIQIILGSTRPERVGEQVAQWIAQQAAKRGDFTSELVDITDFNLPLLDEPVPALMDQYSKDHTKRWAKKIAQADGFIFVTAEYNHSLPAALKNALDFLYKEWNDKAAGFAGYGYGEGILAVASLRAIMPGLRMAGVPTQLKVGFGSYLENHSTFKPDGKLAEQLEGVFDDLAKWTAAMKTVRA